MRIWAFSKSWNQKRRFEVNFKPLGQIFLLLGLNINATFLALQKGKN